MNTLKEFNQEELFDLMRNVGKKEYKTSQRIICQVMSLQSSIEGLRKDIEDNSKFLIREIGERKDKAVSGEKVYSLRTNVYENLGIAIENLNQLEEQLSFLQSLEIQV